MSETIDFKAVAAQLAKPQGESGIKVAAHMNVSNGDMTRHAINLLNCNDGDHVLEIGPGNGYFAEYALSKGNDIRYTGVDISETMISTAREINKSHVDAGRATFEWVNGLHFPFPDNTFDKIFTVNTLYFWQNPAIQLADIRRVLKPNGVFCLAISSKKFMDSLPFTAYGFILYTPEEAQELLLANGFVLMDTEIRDHRTIGAAKEEVIREEVFILAQ